MFDEKFDPVSAVLINVKRNDIKEIKLDVSSRTSQVTQYLGGLATFIGQWSDLNIVIMKCRENIIDNGFNANKLAEPFGDELVIGPILLIRMNENSEPEDLTLREVLESKLALPRRLQRNEAQWTYES